MSDEIVLTQYAIYARPRDAPAHFVVRAWHITRSDPTPVAGKAWLADDLEAARALLPPNLVLIPRQPDDDPVIVETWT